MRTNKQTDPDAIPSPPARINIKQNIIRHTLTTGKMIKENEDIKKKKSWTERASIKKAHWNAQDEVSSTGMKNESL